MDHVIAETIPVTHTEAIGAVGRLIAEVDTRFRFGGPEIAAPSTYPAVIEKVTESLSDLAEAMTVNGDVDAALAKLAGDAIFAIAAIDKQRYNGR